MTQPTLEEIVSAWASDRQDAPRRQARVETQIKYHSLKLLAQGQPASGENLAELTGLWPEVIAEVLGNLQAAGYEFDANGDVVGCALTLNPTRHRLNIDNHHLYAWCALDTLFLPGQIGKVANILSVCPVTGEPIRLTVTPEGVTQVEPPQSVISVVVPGITPECTPDRKTGPESASCSQMHFFSSREAAETWLTYHPEVAILTLEEAFHLARVIWIEPYNRAMEG